MLVAILICGIVLDSACSRCLPKLLRWMETDKASEGCHHRSANYGPKLQDDEKWTHTLQGQVQHVGFYLSKQQ